MKKQLVVYDIELMRAIAQTDSKQLHEWQKTMLNNITGGIPVGTMDVLYGGRQTGKSYYYNKRSGSLCQEILGLQIETVESRIHGSKIIGLKLHGNVPWQEIETWCDKTYGPRSSLWDLEIGRWYVNDGAFWFRNERDITLFTLKWS